MKRLTLTLAMILFAFIGFSQPQMTANTGVIKGKVVDKNDKPIDYVNIVIYKQADSSIIDAVATDSTGYFTFSDLQYDNYYLDVKFIGFENKRIKNIVLTEDNRFIDIGQIVLDHDDQAIDEVVVTGQVSNVTYKIDKKVINVSQDIQAQGGNATDALRNVPSVEVDVDGDVSIRGSSNFTVMINGKPSILDPNEALKQISASNIDRIELITNPSAKYDPDGDAGIINIITKNKTDNGVSGKIEIGGDTYLGYNANLLLSVKHNKFELVSEMQYDKRPQYMLMQQSRITNYDTAQFYLNNTGEHGHSMSGLGWKLGASYYLNDNNTITANFNVGKREFSNYSYTKQETYWSYDDFHNYYVNTSDFIVNGFMSSVDLNFDHKFNDKGHQIKVYGQFSYWEPSESNISTIDTTDANWNSISDYIYQERTVENINRTSYRFQADYELPLGDNSKFEAGYAYRYLISGGDYNVDVYNNTTGEWEANAARYNNMVLYRQIHAAYFTFSGSLPIFDYQVGLRFEHTNRIITEEVTGTDYTINRPDFFPTVHISKQLAFGQQVQLSYSKRINRPRGNELNPFPIYMDAYTVNKGNPALAPEYTHSVELNYLKQFGKSSLSIESYYKQTDGKIDRFQQAEGQTIYMISENLNKDYSIGGEIMGNVVLSKKLTLNIATNLYQYFLDGTLDGVATTVNSFTWNTRANFMAILPTGTSIQIGAFYNAPTITLDGQRDGMFMSYIGAKQSFFNNKLSINLRVQDPLNTMKFSFVTNTENLYSENQFSSLRPSIGLTLTYRINNYKQDKNSSSSSSDIDFGGTSIY